MEQDNNEKFTWNKRYLAICVYAILVVFVSVLIIKAVMGWESTVAHVKGFFAVIAPFIWGAFIAFLINPFVRKLDRAVYGRIKWIKRKDGVRKVLSLVTAYLLVICVFVLGFVYLVPQVWGSIVDIFIRVPDWIMQVNNWIMQLEEENPQFDYAVINDYLNNLAPQLMELSKNIVTDVIPIIFNTSISLVKVVLNMIIAVMVSVYMISDRRILLKGFKKILYIIAPKKTADFTMTVLKECYNIFSQFIFGKAIDSLIIGLICFVAMTLLKLPFTPIISVIVGVTNMIPYFGPFIGAVPGAILVFMVSPIKAIVFVVMIIVLQQFDGLYLGPKILGEKVGVRPLWIIIAITVGGSMAGVVGMFLGVPVVAVLSYLLDRSLNWLVRKKGLDGDVAVSASNVSEEAK